MDYDSRKARENNKGGIVRRSLRDYFNHCSRRPFPLVWTVVILLVFFDSGSGEENESARYVGSLACQPCHAAEYERFVTHARMSGSFRSIDRLSKGLTPEEIRGCYRCHTTGYGAPSGFVSMMETPELANISCEVCHGPGSIHIRAEGETAMKRRLTMEDCEGCHISERVQAFRFKPLIYGGAH
jgi:hypothetical protein